MTSDRSTYEGPYPTPESRGIDAGYDAARGKAERDLASTMAGPKHPLEQPNGEDIKNPDGEFALPATMTATHPSEQAGPGPNQVGNSSGHGSVDPQGQQGGTFGGQRGSPSTDPTHEEGTPLAGPQDRVEQSQQRMGAGIDTKF